MDPNDPNRTIRLDAIQALALHTPHFRVDAHAVHFQGQLEYAMTKAYEYRQPELKMANGGILPIRSTVPRGYESWAYEMYQGTGYAKFFTSGSWRDLPRADVAGTKTTGQVREFGTSYGYTIGEVEKSQASGKPVTVLKGQASRRAFNTLLHNTGLRGDTSNNLQGLLTIPNQTVMSAPAGAAGATRWTTTGATAKTGLEMLADLNELVDTMLQTTNEQERPNVIAMPRSFYRSAQTRKLGTSTEVMRVSVLKQFREDNPEITKVVVINELQTGATDGNPAIMAWREDPESLWLEVPIPYEQHGPIVDGLEFGVAVRGSTGGVICVYPLSVIRIEFGAT